MSVMRTTLTKPSPPDVEGGRRQTSYLVTPDLVLFGGIGVCPQRSASLGSTRRNSSKSIGGLCEL